MKGLKTFLSALLILFLLFTPAELAVKAKESFTDARFVRTENRYKGTIMLYHVVRERPYQGSLTAWLTARAEEFEKRHKGTFIMIEGMDEKAFLERIEQGRVPDAYSFFSGSLWEDRLCALPDLCISFRDGISQNAKAIPYGYTGFVRLTKDAHSSENRVYSDRPVLAARIGLRDLAADEGKADALYVDLRKAGDLIRYREGYASATIQPVDNVTESVCWLGVDRECDAAKYEVLLSFFNELLSEEAQRKLNELGMLSVRSDVRDVPPDPSLKAVFNAYQTVRTFDPFRWAIEYDALLEDAEDSIRGDDDARVRFTIRLQELYS